MTAAVATATTLGPQVEYTNKSADLVRQVRERFLEDHQKNPDKYAPTDVHKIRTNEWYVKRFLLARGKRVDAAVRLICDAMLWRKEFGLPLMKDNMFPLEFYKIGGIFSYERDRQGNIMIYLRIRLHRQVPELQDPVKKFIMHIVDKVDVATDGNGFAIVFDCTGAGYVNMDWDFLKFLINAGHSYFPAGLKYIVVYNIPWMLNPFRKVGMALMPKNFQWLVKFADQSSITEFIAPENLPDYMGGTCKRNYRAVPRGCPSIFTMAIDYGYSEDDIKRILPIFEPLLEEAEEALKQSDYEDPPGFGDNVPDDEQNSISQDDDSGGPSAFGDVEPNPEDGNIQRAQRNNNQELLGVFPSDVVEFAFDDDLNVYQALVHLQNQSGQAMAFKVQSNNSKSYNVTPPSGIILRNMTIRLTIRLRPGYEHLSTDKFLIIGLQITQQRQDHFAQIWNNKDHHPDVVLHKLRSKIQVPAGANVSGKISLANTSDRTDQLVTMNRMCRSLERKQKQLTTLVRLLMAMVVLLTAVVVYSNFGGRLAESASYARVAASKVIHDQF